MSHPIRTACLTTMIALGGAGLFLVLPLYMIKKEAERVTVWAVKPRSFYVDGRPVNIQSPRRTTAAADTR